MCRPLASQRAVMVRSVPVRYDATPSVTCAGKGPLLYFDNGYTVFLWPRWQGPCFQLRNRVRQLSSLRSRAYPAAGQPMVSNPKGLRGALVGLWSACRYCPPPCASCKAQRPNRSSLSGPTIRVGPILSVTAHEHPPVKMGGTKMASGAVRSMPQFRESDAGRNGFSETKQGGCHCRRAASSRRHG